MRTVGLDLAAEPARTAVAVLEWQPGHAEVHDVLAPADDVAAIAAIEGSDKAGIDCPLGWPDAFVAFLDRHRTGQVDPLAHVPGSEWRRDLAYRATDEIVRTEYGLIPLSVATDRIGLTAMRAARLQALLAARGCPVSRDGTGLIVEVYPAASLKHWGLAFRRYKGGKYASARSDLVDALRRQAPWLALGEFTDLCRNSDHVLDAVVCALAARAAAVGTATRPTAAQRRQAAREGWIAVPTNDLADLARA